MGARVTRMFRNFNLENRAHREIEKAKPIPAPRHPTHKDIVKEIDKSPEITETIHQKNDPLLSLLKSVYVESKDPPAQSVKQPKALSVKDIDRRPLKFSHPGDPYGISEITDVPKGKLSIVEALTALSNHKRSPKTWTAEKLAEEYSLDLKDTKALLEFFIPFEVKIIPPKTADTKRIKDT
ncbi:NADH dehydrogenase [ubiquinone] 1 alpha subcomplex assembly factor 4 [Megalops cyprinoides]|uniref:NADH dehydrogenase [ubiquinone] 1 alpha subcomplex assembly factor 4 n=1 Tax=Megalops cyprinoides TaxID=118141 RepID=UPI001864AF9D|nr:NADH dehydrogenase [ubiquinone] 1 alpha subcomplex assembly factor 4 [Megalops cyprinoides]